MIAPIQKFIDSFNKGDMRGAAATHAADGRISSITDEVSPYLWRGPQALTAWAADLESGRQETRDRSDQMVTLSAPTRSETSGDQA